MKMFKDQVGRDWSIEINIPARRKCVADTRFDLFSVLEPEQLKKLNDLETLVTVLFSLCEEQAKKTGVTPDQFAAAFDGDTLELAHEALMEALADFFQKGQRQAMRALLAKGKAIGERFLEAATEEINKLNVESEVRKMLKSLSTKLPAPPDKTPTES